MLKLQPGVPEIVIAATLLLLVAGGIAFGGRGDSRSPAAQTVAAVGPLAKRVEAVRGLRFKHVPKPVLVTPAQTRTQQLAGLDRDYPPAHRRADEQVLETLGLVPSGTDLRDVLGDVASDQVAGFYDTKRKRLAVVDGPAAKNRVLTEITLSHELDHALDDQRFGLRDDVPSTDDRASAYLALVEGTATAVMDGYARRYIPPGAALLSAFSALGGGSSTGEIPPYLQHSLEFSYTGGEHFVSALREAARGRWTLVNRAFATRPPVSMEQVIHPEKYLRRERPVAVALPKLRLGAGWKRTSQGSIGEFDTRELVQLGTDAATADEAATGWGGGRYELWENGEQRVLVVRWRWDSP